MSKVALLNLNQYEHPYPVYPVGLAYLHGALHRAGHTCCYWERAEGLDALVGLLTGEKPDVVGISIRNIDNVQSHHPISLIGELQSLAQLIRKHCSASLILGGSGFSIFPEELMRRSGADYGICGEGEQGLTALIGALEGAGPLPVISGLCTVRDGVFHREPMLPSDVLSLDIPKHFDKVLPRYLEQGSLPGVQTQRGCAFRCCYCTYPLIEGRKLRRFSGDQVADEMLQLKSLGARYAFIVDSVFNTNPEHVEELCEVLIRRDVGISWSCFLRPTKVTEATLKLMQRAGLKHVEFGTDSLSDPVLEAYGKHFTYAEVETASKLANKLGLHYSHFLILGGPGETSETLAETLARAKQLPGAIYFATLGMRVYPDTPLAAIEGAQPRNGTEATSLLEPPCFYRSPQLPTGALDEAMATIQRDEANWIVGDPSPAFKTISTKLRRRGVVGPMWEYIELLQRINR
ncbi:MAG: lipid biosynthesis B12-binding/radical SAM protein [Verrucomicrobiota bacterium]|nr:lipid biosynthesis B12-binding/radical SAM protein [Verrucomicrobiota bacterium]